MAGSIWQNKIAGVMADRKLRREVTGDNPCPVAFFLQPDLKSLLPNIRSLGGYWVSIIQSVDNTGYSNNKIFLKKSSSRKCLSPCNAFLNTK